MTPENLDELRKQVFANMQREQNDPKIRARREENVVNKYLKDREKYS